MADDDDPPVPDEKVISPALNQGFTQGGDLTIQSSDGVNFSVHSVLLSLASPTFADLLTSTNLNETVRFSERAELLALVLKFIYPVPSPIVPSVELLNDTLRVADKYQLTSIKTRLREQLKMADSPVSAYSNPLVAVCVASAHGFVSEAHLAIQVALKQYNFSQPEDLKKLVDMDPSATALAKLVGIPAVKTRILADVLFQFNHAPMILENHVDKLLCAYCRGNYRADVQKSPSEWHARWAHWIFQELRDRPIAEWKDYFDHSNFYRWCYHPKLATIFFAYNFDQEYKICGCAGAVKGAPTFFQPWADGVYKHLKSRLVYISELETRIYGSGPGAKKE